MWVEIILQNDIAKRPIFKSIAFRNPLHSAPRTSPGKRGQKKQQNHCPREGNGFAVGISKKGKLIQGWRLEDNHSR